MAALAIWVSICLGLWAIVIAITLGAELARGIGRIYPLAVRLHSWACLLLYKESDH